MSQNKQCDDDVNILDGSKHLWGDCEHTFDLGPQQHLSVLRREDINSRVGPGQKVLVSDRRTGELRTWHWPSTDITLYKLHMMTD